MENVKPITVQRLEESQMWRPMDGRAKDENNVEHIQLDNMNNKREEIEMEELNAQNLLHRRLEKSDVNQQPAPPIVRIIDADYKTHNPVTLRHSNSSVDSHSSIQLSAATSDVSVPTSDSIGACSLKANGSSTGVDSSEAASDPGSYGGRRDKRAERYLDRRRPARCFCPYGCQYFAWTLCFIVIVGCATITVMYGFR